MEGCKMGYGDKKGICECCDDEDVQVQYSHYSNGWLCEHCWEAIAERVLSGEDD
jgi:recombinational DNA repair protein (RecF pathway)